MATPWTDENFNPDLYLTQRGAYNTALIAKTDFPLSITDYDEDPALTNFQSYYGTSFHFKGTNTWYNRLDFPVLADKIFLYQGINTTDMTLRGSIDIIPTGVTNWTSNNFNPAIYVTQTSLNSQLGSYATLEKVKFQNEIHINNPDVKFLSLIFTASNTNVGKIYLDGIYEDQEFEIINTDFNKPLLVYKKNTAGVDVLMEAIEPLHQHSYVVLDVNNKILVRNSQTRIKLF